MNSKQVEDLISKLNSAFAIAFGAGLGIIYNYLTNWVSKEMVAGHIFWEASVHCGFGRVVIGLLCFTI